MRMLFILLMLSSFSIHADACVKPVLLKPLDNWDIIAVNTANIETAPHFSGSYLSYSISLKNPKAENKVSINKDTGEIMIVAQTKDDFDVLVTAENACGTATSSFNIQIDEEQ